MTRGGETSTALTLRDSRGERQVRVVGMFNGKIAVRNIHTNRLSYIHPHDPRIVRDCQSFSDDDVREAQALMGRLGIR